MCLNSYLQTIDSASVIFKLKGIDKKGIGRMKFSLEPKWSNSDKISPPA